MRSSAGNRLKCRVAAETQQVVHGAPGEGMHVIVQASFVAVVHGDCEPRESDPAVAVRRSAAVRGRCTSCVFPGELRSRQRGAEKFKPSWSAVGESTVRQSAAAAVAARGPLLRRLGILDHVFMGNSEATSPCSIGLNLSIHHTTCTSAVHAAHWSIGKSECRRRVSLNPEWRGSGMLRGSRLKRATSAAVQLIVHVPQSTARVITAHTCMNEG